MQTAVPTIDQGAFAIAAGMQQGVAALRGLGMDAPAASAAVKSALLSSINALGVPDVGGEIAAAGPDLQQLTNALAGQLGTQPTHRKELSVYPYARPSIGASATVIYTDAATGDTKMLMARKRLKSGEAENRWVYPAGYMDLIGEQPLGGDVHADKLLHHAIANGVKSKAQIDGWQEAKIAFSDPQTIREAASAAGIALPPNKDVSDVENAIREVHEETGLDLTPYKDKIRRVDAPTTLSLSSGASQRIYTVAPHFVVDLGTLDTPPPMRDDFTEAGKEIAERKWISLSAIEKTPDSTYMAEGVPINDYAIGPIQQSLNQALSQRIADASAVLMPGEGSGIKSRYRNADNVQVAIQEVVERSNRQVQLKGVPEGIRFVLAQSTGRDGEGMDLLGGQSQKAARGLVAAAKYLTECNCITLNNNVGIDLSALNSYIEKAMGAAPLPFPAVAGLRGIRIHGGTQSRL